MTDMMQLKKPDRNRIEIIAVVLIIVIVAFLVAANIYYQRQESHQRALYYQLQIMRSAINLFKVVERRNPSNLAELAKSVYSFPGDMETRKYLSNVPFDKAGNLVDPFGKIYMYDHSTGWVRSSTSGYEMW